jgi:protein-S-isoprenylcysteine O-methyltransferase Ste14
MSQGLDVSKPEKEFRAAFDPAYSSRHPLLLSSFVGFLATRLQNLTVVYLCVFALDNFSSHANLINASRVDLLSVRDLR